MNYILLKSLKDPDIPRLISVHTLPEIQHFIEINERKYFKFVVKNENVFYYKIFDNGNLIGSVHCEFADKTMYLSLLVFPEYQNKGYGTKILKDVINGNLLEFKIIEVAINDDNIPSLRLFEKVGFVRTSVDGGLITYTYTMR